MLDLSRGNIVAVDFSVSMRPMRLKEDAAFHRAGSKEGGAVSFIHVA